MTAELKQSNELKKRWLKRYINMLTESIFYAEKFEKLDNIKAQKLNDMPSSQPSVYDRVAENICDFDEAEYDHVHNKIVDIRKVKNEIYNAITLIEDGRIKTVMLYRYIDNMDWINIASRIGKESSQVHRLHSEGLNIVEIA